MMGGNKDHPPFPYICQGPDGPESNKYFPLWSKSFAPLAANNTERPPFVRPNSSGDFEEICQGFMRFCCSCDELNPAYIMDGKTITCLWLSLLHEKYRTWETSRPEYAKRNILTYAEMAVRYFILSLSLLQLISF